MGHISSAREGVQIKRKTDYVIYRRSLITISWSKFLLFTFVLQDLKNLLDDCDNKIHAYRGMKSNYFSTNKSSSFNESDEDTLISSQLSKTDIALSMIDVDKIK